MHARCVCSAVQTESAHTSAETNFTDCQDRQNYYNIISEQIASKQRPIFRLFLKTIAHIYCWLLPQHHRRHFHAVEHATQLSIYAAAAAAAHCTLQSAHRDGNTYRRWMLDGILLLYEAMRCRRWNKYLIACERRCLLSAQDEWISEKCGSNKRGMDCTETGPRN